MNIPSRVWEAAAQAPSAARECAISSAKVSFCFFSNHRVAVGVTAAAALISCAAKRYFPEYRVVKAGDAVCGALHGCYASARDWVILHWPARETTKMSVEFVGFDGAAGAVHKAGVIAQASLIGTAFYEKVGSERKVHLVTSDAAAKVVKEADPKAFVVNLGRAESTRGWLADYTIGLVLPASLSYAKVYAEAVASLKPVKQ